MRGVRVNFTVTGSRAGPPAGSLDPEGDTPGRTGAKLGIAPSTLSFHPKELANAGLVHPRPKSRFIVYSADFERMAALMTYLTQNCCQGKPDECLTPGDTALSRCPAPSAS